MDNFDLVISLPLENVPPGGFDQPENSEESDLSNATDLEAIDVGGLLPSCDNKMPPSSPEKRRFPGSLDIKTSSESSIYTNEKEMTGKKQCVIAEDDCHPSQWAGPHFDWLSSTKAQAISPKSSLRSYILMQYLQASPYVPQVGDQVVYIPRGHRDYLATAWQHGRLPACLYHQTTGINKGNSTSATHPGRSLRLLNTNIDPVIPASNWMHSLGRWLVEGLDLEASPQERCTKFNATIMRVPDMEGSAGQLKCAKHLHVVQRRLDGLPWQIWPEIPVIPP
ncbi:unnamed protein product [Protopolystoma xenopodis]|uniref:Uncharacterized protein n=1 Tax=Protopolystoma xenopodis TaxID=117903 RepID=A0A448WIV6_9PLAT|nr:unnamed protein product [Protopolystoma xenopodis]